MKKGLTLGLFAIVFLVVAATFSSAAISGRLGNSRMTLYLDVGETRERYLVVINDNDFPLEVKFSVEGGLADNLKMKEETVSVEANTEKKVYFTVKAKEPGTTETRISVFFTPPEGAGIVLPATIIVVASGESETDNTESNLEELNVQIGGEQNIEPVVSVGEKITPMNILLGISILLIVVFIILVVYARKANSKKRVRRTRG